MRIVLLGAPGAGKTKLAKALAKKLEGTSFIVDGYVQRLEKETDELYGIAAGYAANLQIAVTRLTAERVAKKKGTDHIIICGSTIESLVYNGLRVNRDLFWHKDDEQVQRTLLQIGEGAAHGLGVIISSTIDVKELFLYLPLTDEQKEEYGKSYEVALDKMIPEAVSSLQRPFLTLGGKPTKKANDALKIINEYQQWLASQEASALADGQGTGESRETDKGIAGAESRPLPDLQEQAS